VIILPLPSPNRLSRNGPTRSQLSKHVEKPLASHRKGNLSEITRDLKNEGRRKQTLEAKTRRGTNEVSFSHFLTFDFIS
jgi:hypothetical protein